MSEAFALPPPRPAERDEPPEGLRLDLDAFEGPLDLLLELARRQKVDLLEISMTRLADQYLAFIRAARRDLVVAADYLVMAAWLAMLKSRLLLPAAPAAADPPLDARAEARALAFRLARLQAMREAFADLERRPRLGREVFARGDPDQVRVAPARLANGDLNGLIAAYAAQRRRSAEARYRPAPVRAYPLEAARERLGRLLPRLDRWTALVRVAPDDSDPAARAVEAGPASRLASTLSAGLELVREGALEMRQLQAFDDVWLRRRRAA